MTVCSMHFSSATRVCVTEIAEATLLSVRDNRGVNKCERIRNRRAVHRAQNNESDLGVA